MCLAKLWENHEAAKIEAVKENAHIQLCGLLTDPVPEVRAAAVYALGTFMLRGAGITTSQEIQTIELNLGLTFANIISTDASPLVRYLFFFLICFYLGSYKQTLQSRFLFLIFFLTVSDVRLLLPFMV